jgi:hypothetical protein
MVVFSLGYKALTPINLIALLTFLSPIIIPILFNSFISSLPLNGLKGYNNVILCLHLVFLVVYLEMRKLSIYYFISFLEGRIYI